jgi:large repetitive protein
MTVAVLIHAAVRIAAENAFRFLHVALLGLVLSAAPAAQAQIPPPPLIKTYNVNTTADLIDDNVADGVCHTSANNCSLRAAVIQANHLATQNTVAEIHVPAGIFLLTRTQGSAEENYDLDLTSPLASSQVISILGAGAGRTIIDGNQLSHVIYIEAARAVIIRNVTIRHGNANDGAGLYNNNGSLTVAESVIEDNHASGSGGGINNANGGRLSLQDSTVRANSADGGGGIYQSGTAKIRGSTINANVADNGGGIYNASELVLLESTLSGNNATTDGGGIYSDANAFLYSTSIIGNVADSDHDVNGGVGGGMYAEPGARYVVVNSLIAGNAVSGGFIDEDCDGTFELYGFNLFGDVTGCTFSGDGGIAWRNVLPNTVGPLQDNGGPTLTHALLAGSNAIDNTYDQGCVDETGVLLTTDQRGAPRIAGQRCDVGAVEYGAVVDHIFKNGFD